MKQLEPNLNTEDKTLMERLLSAGRIEYKSAVRLQTVLLRSKGKGTGDIAEFLGIHQSTVSAYINRYNTYGINSLLSDKTRNPGKEPVSQEIKNEIYRLVCNEKPIGVAVHWQNVSVSDIHP